MKRILSLFLASILLVTSLSFTVSADDSASACSQEDAELLYALGVTDSSSLSAAPVTRAQFVRYAMKLAGIPLTPYVGTGFSDVAPTHVDYAYIMSAVDFGLISIADTFRPDENIAPNEAFKIIVHLLGYDFMAAAKGGYPTGYMQTAQTIKLADGVDASGMAMTEYDVCTLLCNALNVKLPEVSYDNKGAYQYSIGTATILSQYRGIVEVAGIVDGVSHYGTYKASGVGEGNVSINGVVYRTGVLSLDSLFGYEVTAYYDTNAKTLISCTPTDSNRVLSIYAEDIESFEDGTYTYIDKNSNTRTASIDVNTTIFYNGILFKYDSQKMIPESGSLTFVSPNSSGTYPTLYINSYKTVVVKRIIMGEDYVVADKYADSFEDNLKFDPDETELVITDQNGGKMEFSSIVEDDILNVSQSDDGKVVEIICVRDAFLGTYSGNSGDYIDVDGSQYRLTASLKDKLSDIITMGKKAIFRLDIDQRIADVAPAADVGEQIGYLVVGKLFVSGMTSRLSARILNLDGKIYDYDFADTFSVNGKGYKDFKTAYTALKNAEYDSMTCGIVKFTVNADGKLSNLVYADNNGGNGGLYVTNTIDTADEDLKYVKATNSIGRDIICASTFNVFKVPNPLYSVDNIDDEQYAVVDPTFLTAGKIEGKKLEGYTKAENDGVSQYIVLQSLIDENDSDNYMLGLSSYMVSTIKKVLLKNIFQGKYRVSKILPVNSQKHWQSFHMVNTKL